MYVLRCGDDSLYCGIARDVDARLAQHQAGAGAKYTRGRGPLQVLLRRRCADHGSALRLEYAFKQLTPTVKRALVDDAAAMSRFARRISRRSRPAP